MYSECSSTLKLTIIFCSKKVLLCECKRHTAHSTVSVLHLVRGWMDGWDTPDIVLLYLRSTPDTGPTTPPSYRPDWYPPERTWKPRPGKEPWTGYPSQKGPETRDLGKNLGLGYPPPPCGQTDTCENSTFPAIIITISALVLFHTAQTYRVNNRIFKIGWDAISRAIKQ